MEEEAVCSHVRVMPSSPSHHSLFVTGPKWDSNVTSEVSQSAAGGSATREEAEMKGAGRQVTCCLGDG